MNHEALLNGRPLSWWVMESERKDAEIADLRLVIQYEIDTVYAAEAEIARLRTLLERYLLTEEES